MVANLFINDLPKTCKLNKISLFSDDMTIYSAAKLNIIFILKWLGQIDGLKELTINDKNAALSKTIFYVRMYKI